MNDINKILHDRNKNYGDYKGGSKFRADVMSLIMQRYKEVNGHSLSYIDIVYIYDLVNKLSRIASTPSHLDSWQDISGYAMLVVNVLKEEELNAD